MNTFLLTVSSPSGDLFRENVLSISLRGTEGDLAVMAGHTPFVTIIKPCEYKIELEDGILKTGQTDGGILTVTKDKVTFLSGKFEI